MSEVKIAIELVANDFKTVCPDTVKWDNLYDLAKMKRIAAIIGADAFAICPKLYVDKHGIQKEME